MKKVFTITILLFMALTSNAQCKFKTDKVDDMYGFRIIETKLKSLNHKLTGAALGISFEYRGGIEDNEPILFIKILLSDNKIRSVYTSDSFTFKLNNDEFVKIYPYENVVTTLKYIGKTPFHELTPRYKVDDELLLNISTNGISMVRFSTQDGYIDVDVNKKNSDKICNDITCFLDKIESK